MVDCIIQLIVWLWVCIIVIKSNSGSDVCWKTVMVVVRVLVLSDGSDDDDKGHILRAHVHTTTLVIFHKSCRLTLNCYV